MPDYGSNSAAGFFIACFKDIQDSLAPGQSGITHSMLLNFINKISKTIK